MIHYGSGRHADLRWILVKEHYLTHLCLMDIFSEYAIPGVMMRINWPIFVCQPYILLPILYLKATGFPFPLMYPPIIFQNLKWYQLPLFIRAKERNISHTLWLHNMKYLFHWVPLIILIPNDVILIIHLIHIRGHPYFIIQIRVFDYVMMNWDCLLWVNPSLLMIKTQLHILFSMPHL